jgi:hypothetical protein
MRTLKTLSIAVVGGLISLTAQAQTYSNDGNELNWNSTTKTDQSDTINQPGDHPGDAYRTDSGSRTCVRIVDGTVECN